MNAVLPLAGGAFALAVIGVALRRLSQRRQALERLFEADAEASDVAEADARVERWRPWLKRYRWVPASAGLLIGGVAYLLIELAVPFVVAASVLVTLLGWQVESWLAARRLAKLELQLADAIDLMVGALGAGAGATASLEAALTEMKRPLQPVLDEVLSRIRLGDNPQHVFNMLTHRIPLETFLLFASTLAVHWEVGGTLAPTLATVGRTIRDRIELGRKIRSNSVQAQMSVVAVLFVTYFIAGVMWRTSPDRMTDFLETTVASWLVAGSIILQAVGIVWMSTISRARF
ncbi:MAG: type II secretion system F family protein [Planctomycetota bacterium]|nr:type II secretion system F family protein [Planctomycetota bacterium]